MPPILRKVLPGFYFNPAKVVKARLRDFEKKGMFQRMELHCFVMQDFDRGVECLIKANKINVKNNIFQTFKKYKQYEIDAFYKKHDMLTDLNTYTFDEIYESYAEAFPYLTREWEDRALPRCNKKCGSNHRNVSRYTEN